MCENTTLNKKPFSFDQYPFQREIAADEHPNLSCEKCSQVGLSISLDTPIPTPTGWTTMGDLQVGDQVFDEQGNPCSVTYKSPVWIDRDCYEVEFDTGEIITCDGSHRWYVEADRSFDLSGNYSGFGRPSSNCEMFKAGVLDTKTIARLHKQGQRNRFAIPNTKPLYLPDQDLPLDPYLLGLMLGDGNFHTNQLTIHQDDAIHILSELHRRGLDFGLVSSRDNVRQYVVYSLHPAVSKLDLVQNKHIPKQYLRCSVEQRLQLLRGLMDTDGSVTKRGRCSFYNTNPELVVGVEELAQSLGYKTRTRWKPVGKPSVLRNGHTITPRLPVAEVSFVAYADQPIFNLPRKRERLPKRETGRPTEALRRRIVNVRKVASVPTQCITVDSPSHLYLCGKGMIPTHNTEIQIRKFFALLRRNTSISGIFSLPSEKMFKRIYNGRMKPILDADDVFTPKTGIVPIRNMSMIQIMDSFGYVTGCTEGDATSISADFLMHDELDLSPMDMIGLFQSRLQNSDMKMTQSFSTPTFLDYGINRQYQLSDQREYLIKCSSCNHWQAPRFDFPFLHIPMLGVEVEKLTDLTPDVISDLPLDEIYVRCEKCHSRLDLGNAEQREWVATYPTRTASRGYKVRPFSTARITPAYMFMQLSKYQQQDFLRGFYNTVLGEPFTESSAQMQRHEIEHCFAPTGAVPNIGRQKPVFLGLDMGQVCHLTLHTDGDDGEPVFVLFEQIPVFQLQQRLSELRKVYSIVQGCADRFPYTPTVDQFRDETAGIIMPVQYAGKAYILPHRDEAGTIDYYSANRTAALDRVRSVIVNQQAVLAGYGQYRETIITHLRDMVRDEKPETEPEWKKLNGNDHFFHSMALSLLARRVCEHVYMSDTKSLLSNVVLQGLGRTAQVDNLGNFSGGAAKISRLK